jgi:peptidoglycan/xylan/chitin deacetylase (PgdA/CDA1 family)
MEPNLTIIIYHYVRPIAGSAYPGIKGLELSDFDRQLDYIQQHHKPISMQQLIDAASGGSALPQNAALLTFDDGYADHYQHVFPRLKQRGMSGVFFPPARAVQEGNILDVNKIQFILASVGDVLPLIHYIERSVEAAKGEFSLESLAYYRDKYYRPGRFDTIEVIYIKRMLQVALRQDFRSRIVAELFARHVSTDEKDFASGLYCSLANLREMVEAGMSIGGHGYAHNWLDSLTPAEQADDIDRSLNMLEVVGALKQNFLFCYPYGAYTADTLSLLKERSCRAAFTGHVSTATITPGMSAESLLQLPRLDTNDLPRKTKPEAQRRDEPACGRADRRLHAVIPISTDGR